MPFENGQTLLFTGDSITDCDRGHPVGSGSRLGSGYVSLVDNLLAAWHPELSMKILNTGVSGSTVVDLETNWQRNVLDIAPDWLSVMIGINDVWRQFDSRDLPDVVTLERYEKTYRGLLEQTRPGLRGLVLMTPYFIEPRLSEPMRGLMDSYGEVVERLAQDFEAVFVDVQAAFDAYLAHRPPQSLAEDRVHPNSTGHMIIARSFLTAMGFD